MIEFQMTKRTIKIISSILTNEMIKRKGFINRKNWIISNIMSTIERKGENYN